MRAGSELLEKMTRQAPKLGPPTPPCWQPQTGIARYVQDPEIRKTPAGDRRFEHRGDPGRHHRSAVQAPLPGASGQEHQRPPRPGRTWSRRCPRPATTPDAMTALWEQSLGQIAERHGSYQQFMGPLDGAAERLD